MTKNTEVWQLIPGDTVIVKGDPMIIKTMDADFVGVQLGLIDSKGHGHVQNFGHDDIVPRQIQ